MQNTHNKYSNILVILTILICTLWIIMSNYFYLNHIQMQIVENIQQDEYNRVGGKENYLIYNQLQKQEFSKYIGELTLKQPEYVYQLRQENNTWKKMLSWEQLKKYKKDSQNDILVLEFSDLECPGCKNIHNQNEVPDFIKTNSGSISYSFEHFPLPQHKNALFESMASICINTIISDWSSIDFIDHVFKNTKSWGEGFALADIHQYIKDNNIDQTKFEDCYTNETTKTEVLKAFDTARKLGVQSTPSFMVIDTKNGSYEIFTTAEETNNILSEKVSKNEK